MPVKLKAISKAAGQGNFRIDAAANPSVPRCGAGRPHQGSAQLGGSTICWARLTCLESPKSTALVSHFAGVNSQKSTGSHLSQVYHRSRRSGKPKTDDKLPAGLSAPRALDRKPFDRRADLLLWAGAAKLALEALALEYGRNLQISSSYFNAARCRWLARDKSRTRFDQGNFSY